MEKNRLTDAQIANGHRLHRLRRDDYTGPSQLCDAFTAGARYAESLLTAAQPPAAAEAEMLAAAEIDRAALLGEAERIAANLHKNGHYLAARVMRMLAAMSAGTAPKGESNG